MNQDYTKLLGSILKNMALMDHIRPSEIPNIDLYMDQVTSFMNDHLQSSRRFEDDKILTKTMINNYAKNKLLPPPIKKRYSKEHLFVLVFIYYMKGFFSLSDIQTILKPVTDRFAESDESLSIEDIYAEVHRLGSEHISDISRDIMTVSTPLPILSKATTEKTAIPYSFLILSVCSVSISICANRSSKG